MKGGIDPDLGGLLPDDNRIGHVANTGVESKFDDGFYAKVQGLIATEPIPGEYGVYDGTRYYDVILVVSRDDGDDRDPDEVSQENKDALVKRLELLGAKNIIAAKGLSFVTASIPIAEVPGFSDHDEVYQVGDGELVVSSDVDTARQTIHATNSEIIADNTILTGAGVLVAVLDDGINHSDAFGDNNSRVSEHVRCNNAGPLPL